MIKKTVIIAMLLASILYCFLNVSPNAALAEEGAQQAWVTPAQNIDMASNSDFVDLQQLIPGIQVDLKYATSDNITGHPIYNFDRAYLRKGPALKLRAAEAEAEQMGYRLKILDAYRPPSAQFALWAANPNPDYIANPYTTYSYHSRGEAVDVTMTDMQGNEITMPSQFDDSTGRASRNWPENPPTLAANAQILQKIIEDHGLAGIRTEWWHFQDNSVQYPVANLHIPNDITLVGSNTSTNVSAFIVDGRSLAPLRDIVSLLGLSVQWDSDRHEIAVMGPGKTLMLQPENEQATINGSAIALDTAPRIIVATTFAPLRDLSAIFGYSITWDSSTRTATIRKTAGHM